jgi:hypothetical protein
MFKTLALSIIGMVLAAPALADDLSVDARKSSLTYHLIHKLKKVHGVSRRVEGRARLLPDGRAQVMVRTSADSFDSGNVNRDAHMKEAIESERFPTVELKAFGEGLFPPARFPVTVEKSFKVQIEFHGVRQLIDLPLRIVWESPDRAHALGRLVLSLESFGVERPSLMFVKVDDALAIDADLWFTK